MATDNSNKSNSVLIKRNARLSFVIMKGELLQLYAIVIHLEEINSFYFLFPNHVLSKLETNEKEQNKQM